MTHRRRFWLVKSEPEVFSIDDLARSPKQTSCWDGVRNYQARNFMREMAVGDYVLFYHSNADPPSIVGSAEVVKTAYPDDTQFDKRSDHYDPASTADRPRWEMVDLKYREKFPISLPLDRLKSRETCLATARAPFVQGAVRCQPFFTPRHLSAKFFVESSLTTSCLSSETLALTN